LTALRPHPYRGLFSSTYEIIPLFVEVDEDLSIVRKPAGG
jgi:hypothetical protein